MRAEIDDGTDRDYIVELWASHELYDVPLSGFIVTYSKSQTRAFVNAIRKNVGKPLSSMILNRLVFQDFR